MIILYFDNITNEFNPSIIILTILALKNPDS